MPYSAKWLVPYRVMTSKMSGRVTLEDIDAHTEASVKFLTEAQIHAPGKLVYNVFDTSQAENGLPIYLMMTKALTILSFTNSATLYHVTQSRELRSIGDLTAHLMSFAIRTYDDYDEAVQAVYDALAREDLQISH